MSELDDDLTDVDPLLADYVDAFREVETPPQRAVDATWAKIEEQTKRPFGVWIPVALVAAAALILVALMDPASMLEREGDLQPEQVPYRSETPTTAGEAVERPKAAVPRPKAAERPKAAVPAPVPAPVPETEPVPEPKPEAKPARAKPRPQPPADPGPSTLAQETSLIGEIRRAQASGRYAEVVLLTGQHAKRFPRGAFADERALARARALCSLGKKAQARKASATFVRQHPKSHLVPQFEAICAE